MSEQGKCPKCGSNSLAYDAIKVDGEEVCYPFACVDCGFFGNEWHKLVFEAMTDEEGEEV